MRILIAEDEFTSRVMLHNLLKIYGQCDVAADGKEAEEAFRTAIEGGEPYNLVCLDVLMPATNGTDVLKEIRRLEAERGISSEYSTKVILTTAGADRNTMAAALQARCDGYIGKPYDRKAIAECLRTLGLVLAAP